MKSTLKFLFLLTIIFNSNCFAQKCLSGKVSLITEDGMRPAHKGVPITIKGIDGKNLGTTETDRFGKFCITPTNPSTKIAAGREINFEMGDENEKSQKWSSWVILSPYQGITYFPNSDVYRPLEVIIIPSYMHSTFFKPKKTTKQATTCPISKGTPIVQVASMRSIEEAKKIENAFKANYRTCVLPVRYDNKDHYRVLILTAKNQNPKKVCRYIRKHYKLKCEPH